MATEVRTFAATIAAGTPSTAPTVTAMAVGTRIVERVQILVPPGANGLVGFALRAAGQQVIPYGSGQWIVANGETIDWPLDGQIESGAWSLLGYNNGIYPHTLQVRFLLTLPRLPQPNVQPIPAAMLSGTL